MVDLVTGGAGFIGSHLVARLVRDGRRVLVIDNLTTGDVGRLAPIRDLIDFVQADLVTADLEPLLAGVQRVFHLAAVPSVPRSVRDPLTTHEAVATATVRLLLAARDAGVDRFVFSSSSSVYGETSGLPKREEMPLQPVSPYGVAKAAAERYVNIFASLYGLRTVSLRYFNVFGPAQDPSSQYAAVIPLFIGRALGGEELVINGDGEQTRDFTFVDNVIDANLVAASAQVPPGRVYNAAAGSPRSLNALVAVLGQIVGKQLATRHGPPRPGDIRHSHADISRARDELGWAPTVTFEDGLRQTLLWYTERNRAA